MPGWENSDRRDRLPPDWPAIRARVLKRDGYQCRKLDDDRRRCPKRAVDVDHIERGDDHREENLQSLCTQHHGTKTGREGAAAKAAAWKRNNQKFRRTEKHPGVL